MQQKLSSLTRSPSPYQSFMRNCSTIAWRFFEQRWQMMRKGQKTHSGACTQKPKINHSMPAYHEYWLDRPSKCVHGSSVQDWFFARSFNWNVRVSFNGNGCTAFLFYGIEVHTFSNLHSKTHNPLFLIKIMIVNGSELKFCTSNSYKFVFKFIVSLLS